MPTYNRRNFIYKSIALFQAQNYSSRELIIIDDGEDSVIDLIPNDTRIVYHRLNTKLTVGAKRNLGCELARGSIIAHWDDDDWHAFDRLTYQIGELQQSNADLVGIQRLLFFEPSSNKAWEYYYCPAKSLWFSGSTLCYKRKLWESHHFSDVNVGEDVRFVAGANGIYKVLQRYNFHVGIIHENNISKKNINGKYWKEISNDHLPFMENI
jgi:glycosyltransferase involved in cell wall biosynthesis